MSGSWRRWFIAQPTVWADLIIFPMPYLRSQMMMANVAPNTVQEYMGHADLKTTLRYAHVSEEYKRKAIQSLPY